MDVSRSAGAVRRFEMGEGLTLTLIERGEATSKCTVLLLHGGAGICSVTGLADHLSARARVLAPIHPGFDEMPRPEWFDSVGDLATAYLDVLDELDLSEVLVIGISLGGWIAAEMALRDNHGRIGGLVLIGPVGIRANDPREIEEAIDVDRAEFVRRIFHDPDAHARFVAHRAKSRTEPKSNVPMLRLYGGKPYMHDPKLRRRLRRVTVPVLVIWGECDQITPLEYGLVYAQAFPRARFQPIADTGHMPQVESLEATLGVIAEFITTELPHIAPW
ncbi:alpha/beta fold hydrolase [Amycolatopsis pigmentata]|uniref:Alpha/beta fold hydrolase n=1 Tax=Amycolatopsis pigmentata TaxID=450801 RepID=A0ABW5G0K5_9PSEU